MKLNLFLAFSLVTLGTANVDADTSHPTDGFVDKLANGANVTINEATNLSASFAPGGLTLTVIGGSGSEWYWSNGAGSSYDNDNNLAFPLGPTSKQTTLIITVTSITPGAALEVGAFLFKDGALVNGKSQLLGADNGGLNITAPGTYQVDVSAAAKKAGVIDATGWKADFWFAPDGIVGQTVTISSISASTSTSTPVQAPQGP